MYDLLTSATTATDWARAMESGFAKYGATPIYDDVTRELGPVPVAVD